MMDHARELPLERLLGRVVRTAAGRPIGVIQDLRAFPEGEEYVVREFLLGELGLKAKLLGLFQQLPTFRALGVGKPYRTRAIPWQWLDLSDPERPFIRSGKEKGEDG